MTYQGSLSNSFPAVSNTSTEHRAMVVSDAAIGTWGRCCVDYSAYAAKQADAAWAMLQHEAFVGWH